MDPLDQLAKILNDDRFYDRQGQLVSFTRYLALKKDESYRVLGNDLALSVYRVSTVWTGIPGCKFETLVWVEGADFDSCDVEALRWRYESEHAALQGHAAVVEQLGQGIDPKAVQRPGAN